MQSSRSLTSVAPPFAFGQQATDTALNVVLIVVFLISMVSLGCTMEIAKTTAYLRRPQNGNSHNGSVQHHALDTIPIGQALPAGHLRIPGHPHLSLLPPHGETSPTSLAWHWEGTWTSGKKSYVLVHCPSQSCYMTGSETNSVNIRRSQEASQRLKYWVQNIFKAPILLNKLICPCLQGDFVPFSEALACCSWWHGCRNTFSAPHSST